MLNTLRKALRGSKKILIAGNGGSCAQADHFAGELVGIGLPCISLSNPAVITAIGNDFTYRNVFSKQVEAYGNTGDVFIGLTTSGSPNIYEAVKTAQHLRLHTWVIGGGVINYPDGIEVVRFTGSTQLVQEKTIKLLHAVYLKLKAGL